MAQPTFLIAFPGASGPPSGATSTAYMTKIVSTLCTSHSLPPTTHPSEAVDDCARTILVGILCQKLKLSNWPLEERLNVTSKIAPSPLDPRVNDVTHLTHGTALLSIQCTPPPAPDLTCLHAPATPDPNVLPLPTCCSRCLSRRCWRRRRGEPWWRPITCLP